RRVSGPGAAGESEMIMNAIHPPHPAMAAGNVAAVTGGASGIGLATAAKLLQMEMKVCIFDRNGEALAAARQSFAAYGGKFLALEVDVADESAVREAAAEVKSGLGPVSFSMNNAAIGGGGDGLNDSGGWKKLLDINLMG